MSKKRDEENAVIANSGNIFADARVRLDQRVFNESVEIHALRAWSEFNGFAS